MTGFARSSGTHGATGWAWETKSVNNKGIERLESGFRELGLSFAESDANFLLVRVGPRVQEIYDALLRRGVITRPMDAFGLTEHLRITVGLGQENERLLTALREVMKP